MRTLVIGEVYQMSRRATRLSCRRFFHCLVYLLASGGSSSGHDSTFDWQGPICLIFSEQGDALRQGLSLFQGSGIVLLNRKLRVNLRHRDQVHRLII